MKLLLLAFLLFAATCAVYSSSCSYTFPSGNTRNLDLLATHYPPFAPASVDVSYMGVTDRYAWAPCAVVLGCDESNTTPNPAVCQTSQGGANDQHNIGVGPTPTNWTEGNNSHL